MISHFIEKLILLHAVLAKLLQFILSIFLEYVYSVYCIQWKKVG